MDLTSCRKMTMNVINAVARFERDLLVERTQSGLARAKAAGKPLGRPSTLTAGQQNLVKGKIRNGETISSIVRQFGTSRQTIMRVRDQPWRRSRARRARGSDRRTARPAPSRPARIQEAKWRPDSRSGRVRGLSPCPRSHFSVTCGRLGLPFAKNLKIRSLAGIHPRKPEGNSGMTSCRCHTSIARGFSRLLVIACRKLAPSAPSMTR